MTVYYFNTNPFVHWAKSKATYPEPDSADIGKRVAELVDDVASVSAVSEITLAEFYHQIHLHWRDTRPEKQRYSATWAEAVIADLMRWIESGRLSVLKQPPKLIENATLYVAFATREHGRDLSAWDASHLYQASYWARELNERVTFVTSDDQFRKILDVYPEFQEYVEIMDPGA